MLGRRRSHPQFETLRAFPLFEGVSDARLVQLAERAQLLALDEPAFRALLDDLPEVGRRIREEATLRLAVNDPSDN